MLPKSPILGTLFSVLGFAFNLWPLLPLTALLSRGHVTRTFVFTWLTFAVIRALIALAPRSPSPALLIPEPLNTNLFVVTGAVLIVVYIAVRVWQPGRIDRKLREADGIPDLLQVTPKEFAEMVAELFRFYGHQVERMDAPGKHGVDLIIRAQNGAGWIVRCKRQRGRIEEMAVREFERTMKFVKARRGVMVVTGSFTDEARQWAKNNSVLLYDGDELLKALRQAWGK
jgi:restriction system protein